MTAFLLLVAGAALGGLVTILVSRLTPRLVFHPDIHWSAGTRRYSVRVRNRGHVLNRDRAGTPAKHQLRAPHRWGHIIDLTMTATLVIPDGPLNWHRLNVPALNGDFAHLQPGDTRLLLLDLTGLSAAAQELLQAAAKARSCALEVNRADLLEQLRDWTSSYVLVEAIGNDAWSAGRRCWEQRYPLSGPDIALRAGNFPIGPHSDRTACRRPDPSAAASPSPSSTPGS
jgi:hypothetical protein